MLLLSLLLSTTLCEASPLKSLHDQIDTFFEAERTDADIKNFSNLIGRSIGLERGPRLKRDAADIFQDEWRINKDVFVSNEGKIANINVFELNGITYIISIETSTFEPKFKLVLYNNKEGFIKKISQYPVESNGLLEIYVIGSRPFIIITQSGSEKFKTLVFQMEEETLNLLHTLEFALAPTAVKIISHLGQIYLGVATKKMVYIYKWNAFYFDMHQKLIVKNAESIDFTSIDSTLHLALAGDTSDECRIWVQKITSNLFECLQHLDPISAANVVFFKTESDVEKTFLAVGYKNQPAIIYYKEGIFFEPFQYFPNDVNGRWIPVKDEKQDVALLLKTPESYSMFVYDGWRFSNVQFNLNLESDLLNKAGTSIRFYPKEQDTLLIANNAKLKVTSVISIKKSKKESPHSWCSASTERMEKSMDELVKLANRTEDYVEMKKDISFDNVEIDELKTESIGNLTGDLVDKVNALAKVLATNKELMEELSTVSVVLTSDEFTVNGSRFLDTLELRCGVNAPCLFENLWTTQINKVPIVNVLSSMVYIDKELEVIGMRFENLRSDKVYVENLNNRPAKDLVKHYDNLNIPYALTIDGDVVFHGDVFVNGEIQGVVVNKLQAVLEDQDQLLAGELKLKSASADDLSINGTLNGADLAKLNVGSVLPTIWDDLTIANLTLDGNFEGIPMWKLLGKGENVTVDALNVTDGKISGIPLDDLVLIKNGVYEFPSEFNFIDSVYVKNLYVSGSINRIPQAVVMDLLKNNNSNEKNVTADAIVLDNLAGHAVIVDGRAKLDDISSPKGKSILNHDYLATYNQSEAQEKNNEEEDFDYDSNSSIELDATQMRYEEINVKWIAPEVLNQCLCKIKYKNSTRASRSDEKYEIYDISGLTHIQKLKAEKLEITGLLDGLNWTDFVNDAVLSDQSEFISGFKIVKEKVDVLKLNVSEHINGQTPTEFIADVENELTIDGDVVLNGTLSVENVIVNGTPLIKSSEDNSTQSFVIKNVLFDTNVSVERINNISTSFLSEIIHINEDVKLGTINYLDDVMAENITTNGLLNGAPFAENVILKSSSETQEITGHWLFGDDVVINGEFNALGEANGRNLTSLCRMANEPFRVIVGGSVSMLNEITVKDSVNNVHLQNFTDVVWLKNRETTFSENVNLSRAQIVGELTLKGKLNGLNLTAVSDRYLSKSIPRTMNANLYLQNLEMFDDVNISNMTGKINGLDLGDFAAKALQNNLNQSFRVRPSFHQLEVKSLTGDHTFSKTNLSEDVLRYDVENAIVTGDKTLSFIEVEDIILPKGKKIQNVDIKKWMAEAVDKRRPVLEGNVTFSAVNIDGDLSVHGKIGNVHIDKDHVLTTSGKGVITAPKMFSNGLEVGSIEFKGLVNNVSINEILENVAYPGKDLDIKENFFIEDLEGKNLYISGNVTGVDVNKFCQSAANETKILDLDEKFAALALLGEAALESLSDEPFYLDHFRMYQKIRLNVTAISAVPGFENVIAVFYRQFGYNNVTLLTWDGRERSFKRKEGTQIPTLNGNMTMVSSGSSFLLTETWEKGLKLFHKNHTFDINVTQATCGVPVGMPGQKCFYIGFKNENDVLMCRENKTLIVTQTFNTTSCIQAVSVSVGNHTWIIVIGRTQSRPSSEISVTLFSNHNNRFVPRQDLAILHPAGVAAVMYRRNSYLVVASQHQPESVRSSLLSILRFKNAAGKWVRYQEIRIEAPTDVSFEELPSGQLALYVLTAHPSKPFVVFMYRGVEGFVEETAGLATRVGRQLTTFNAANHHFVGIGGSDYGQILKAEMQGRRYE